MKTEYAGLRTGMRIVKLVAPRGGRPTNRLTGRVASKGRDGDSLVVCFDDQTRMTTIPDGRQQCERGLIRRQRKGRRQS